MTKQLDLDGITIVFDLDGTLVDTAPDLVAALNVSLINAGLNGVPQGAVQGQIGLGSKAMLEEALRLQDKQMSDAEIDAMRNVFLGHYADNTANKSTPYPGVIDALNRLEKAGAAFAICTNKPQGLADTLLNELQLRDRFRAIVGSDSVLARKPDPSHLLKTIELAAGKPQSAIMIGDSNPDEKAAQNAGLPFVFIPFGYGPIDQSDRPRIELPDYNKLKPDFILDLFSA
ncbi:MAG: HAD-IA family hydrolase [Hyphomonadaceae bacterium]